MVVTPLPAQKNFRWGYYITVISAVNRNDASLSDRVAVNHNTVAVFECRGVVGIPHRGGAPPEQIGGGVEPCFGVHAYAGIAVQNKIGEGIQVAMQIRECPTLQVHARADVLDNDHLADR